MKFEVGDIVEWDFDFDMTEMLHLPEKYGKGPFRVTSITPIHVDKALKTVGADCWITTLETNQISGAFFKKVEKKISEKKKADYRLIEL